MREALFYGQREDGSVDCLLCPHHCHINREKVGSCRVRKNVAGTLYSLNYARVTSVAMDPIEKKPLYHFHPGTEILSLGTFGCNFRCPFCQNWQISQAEPSTQELSPQQAVELAKRRNSVGIAYTYNEPIIWAEYVLDTAKLAQSEALKNVMVTNGFINAEPLAELLPFIDAFNIDLKSIEEGFYRKLCGGRLQPVLEAAVQANKRAHVEVTHLIIPGHNDVDEQFHRLAGWVKENLGPSTPTHLSAYVPHYRLEAPPTPLETLQRACKIFREHLDHVYLGNVLVEDGSHTRCSKCGSLLIARRGYMIEMRGLSEGRCQRCGAENNIVAN